MNSTTINNTTIKEQLWFIVPAAGVGRRMRSQQSKQYLALAGSTVLEQTLNALLAIDDIAGIVVAIHANDRQWESLVIADHEKIHNVRGGKERCDSVLAALHFLEDKMSSVDWVLVHDAARPCIQPQSVQKMINELHNDEVGGILAVPVSDTLKKVNDEQCIQATVDRSTIYQAQTPQMFRYGVIYRALTQATDHQQPITDEASAVEQMGLLPKVVIGCQDNIKITHSGDLWLAEMILRYYGTINTKGD